MVMGMCLLDSFRATVVARLHVPVTMLMVLVLLGGRSVISFLSVTRAISWFLALSVHQLLLIIYNLH